MPKSLSDYPGFKFAPTEEELIVYYLRRKIEGYHKCVDIIPEVDMTKHEPWDLPEKSVIPSNTEWYFFYPRGRKYPKGSQSKRATACGYWKATGKERKIKSGTSIVGTKRTLVFHKGRAPKGKRTEWIMHEYCMSGTPQETFVVCRIYINGEFSSSEISRTEIRQTLTGESSTAAAVNDIQENVFNGHTENNVENQDVFQENNVENQDVFQENNVENQDVFQENNVENQEMFQENNVENQEMFQENNVENQDMFQENKVENQDMFQENKVENQDMFQENNAENQEMFQENNAENQEMFQGLAAPDGCSHSVEHLDTEPECEKKPGSPICQPSTDWFGDESECDKKAGSLYFRDESCSLPKGFEGVADDYFDNILKDDVFKLDKSSLLSSDHPGKDILYDDFMDYKPTVPFQGTAPRRIRLKSRQRIRRINPLPFQGTAPRRMTMMLRHIDKPINHRHTMSDVTMNHRRVMVLVVLLGLLIVFLAAHLTRYSRRHYY